MARADTSRRDSVIAGPGIFASVSSGQHPGFIAAYNARFGRDPANVKDLHRPLTQSDELDEILAWREERTVTRNLTLHYDRMMLLLDPTPLARDLVAQ
jgi:hypothetical protein